MLTQYETDLAELDAAGADYSWALTGNGGHTLTVIGAWGTRVHTHYRADGSRYLPHACGCWER